MEGGMWIFDVLTIVLVVLKLIGAITWSWLVVLSPMIVEIVLYTLIRVYFMSR